MPNPWIRIQQLGAVLRPGWLASLVVVAISCAFQHEQTLDALHSIARDVGKDSTFWRHLSLLAWTLVLALCGWYFPRALLYVRYWFTPSDEEDSFQAARRWAPRALGTAPIVSLAIAFARRGDWYFTVGYSVVAVAFVAFLIYRRKWLEDRGQSTMRLYEEMPAETFRILLAVLGVGVLLLVVFLISHVQAPQFVGPVGIVLVAAATWIAAGSMLLVYPTYRYRWPSLVLVALLITVAFGLWNDNHRVRTLPGDDVWARESVSSYFQGWLSAREESRRRFREAGRPYPVFVVAAEGGGIRAAYWTASVLAQLEDTFPGFACHLFGVSGVSGGSLGGAVFAGLMADRVVEGYRCPSGGDPSSERLTLRAQRVLGHDFLGPALAGMLFPDLAQRFWPFTGALAFPDRARYLEQAWERAWQDETNNDRFAQPFRQLWPDPGSTIVPSLFLNGTWVEDGGRAVTSSLSPASSRFVALDDLVNLVDRPIRLSTAVHMSARFTYVSPAGLVGKGRDRRRVVDGGYFENSGAMTAAELLAVMRDTCGRDDICRDPAIVFVALVVINDPGNPFASAASQPKRLRFLRETLIPPVTLFRTRTARGYLAQQFLEQQVGSDCTIRFVLATEPGESKVPLGWMLSGATRTRMNTYLQEIPVDAVARWLGKPQPEMRIQPSPATLEARRRGASHAAERWEPPEVRGPISFTTVRD